MDRETYLLSELKRKNIPVKEAFVHLGVSKQTFYNKIKDSKPDEEFWTKVKEVFKIDILRIGKQDAYPSNETNQQPNMSESLKDKMIENLLDQVNQLKKELSQYKEGTSKSQKTG